MGFRRRLVLALTMVALPATAAAQQSQCTITQDEYGRMSQVQEDGEDVLLIHDPFVVTCDDGAELRASTGRLNQATREVYLLGEVFFQDTLQTLTSQEATYNANTGYLWAQGDVVYVNRQEGSSLRGPELEYFRVTEERPVSRMNATRRPTLSIAAPEDASDPQPMELVADRVEIVGEDDMSAFGTVVITRDDLQATADQAFYNSSSEELQLRIQAFVRSGEYELEGDAVDAVLSEGAIEYLNARTGAALRGEDLEVSGSSLMLFFAQDLLQRVVALAGGDGGEAVATSTTFRMQADSLDAVFVDQRLDEVYAVGNAYGETIDTAAVPVDEPVPMEVGDDPGPALPDSTAAMPDVLARDWIRGDTIIGYFVAADDADTEGPSVETADTELAEASDASDLQADAGAPDDGFEAGVPDADLVAEDPADALEAEEERPTAQLRQLIARGGAQSLYRVAGPDDETGERRNANFLVGREIVLEMVDGELDVATVEGLQYGVYVEAEPREEAPEEDDETGDPVDSADPADDIEPDPAGGV